MVMDGLPERLRENRKMRGLTQAELGAKAGACRGVRFSLRNRTACAIA